MSNFLEPGVVDALKERLYAGMSIRAIMQDLKIARNSVQRYKRIWFPNGRDIVCPCGKLAEHKGWCSYRYDKSTARQAFIARWLKGRPPKIICVKSTPRLNLNYPFLPKAQPELEGVDLVLLVNGAVPKHLPEQLRADVCQEICAAIIGGEIQPSEIGSNVKRYISMTRKLSESHYMAFSIDQPRRDGRSWHDLLTKEES